MDPFIVACEHCGVEMECCRETDIGRTVLCRECFKPNRIIAPSESLEIDDPDCELHGSRNDFFGNLKEARKASVSLETPAAPPTQNKDPDKALTNVALGIVRLNNWPCQEDPGYRSFTARVRFSSSQLGCTSVDDFKISAENGLLIFESPVIDLPDLPGIPLLETLNEINQRSVSALFVKRDNCILIRHALIPRTREEGFLTAGMLLQTLRQMNHDRRHGLSLIREVVEKGHLQPLDIARAFAQPMAQSKAPPMSLSQTADLSGFAGFVTHTQGNQIAISREMVRADRCIVRLAACPGFIRGWVTLGDNVDGHYTWTYLPEKLREMFGESNGASGKLNQLYGRLNELNQRGGLIRYVLTQKHVVVTSTYFNLDQQMSVEQFQVFASSLLGYADTNMPVNAPPIAKIAV